MPAHRRRCERWLMTDVINVSANDPLLMDAAVKRSGSRLQGGARLPVRTLWLQWGNTFPSTLYFIFHTPPSPPQKALCRQVEPCSWDNEGMEQTEGLFLIQRTFLSSSFLFKNKKRFSQSTKKHFKSLKICIFFSRNVADNDEMWLKFDGP